MNAKQKEMFEQKWQESAATYNANPTATESEMEETADKGRCERIVNAVLEAGVPKIKKKATFLLVSMNADGEQWTINLEWLSQRLEQINAVIEAGVPEIEWQLDDEKTDNECKDWRGIVNGSVILEVWEDEEEQWLVTGIGASDKYCLSLHGQSYPSFAEAKSAAGEAFRAWWLKAQGEQDEGTLKSAV